MTLKLQDKPSNATYIAKVRSTPDGEIKLVPGDPEDSVYGEIEIDWYPDRLKITAPGAGPASITQAYLSGKGQDVIIEIGPPRPPRVGTAEDIGRLSQDELEALTEDLEIPGDLETPDVN